MPSLTTLAIISAIAAVLYGLGRAIMASLKQGGVTEAERDEAMRDREAARKQAEIMLEERSTEDVAKDLDDGRF